VTLPLRASPRLVMRARALVMRAQALVMLAPRALS
jgi:hypothetical protein